MGNSRSCSVSMDGSAFASEPVLSGDAELGQLIVSSKRLLRNMALEKQRLEVQPKGLAWLEEEMDFGDSELAKMRAQEEAAKERKYTEHEVHVENDVKWVLVTPVVRHRGAKAMVKLKSQDVELELVPAEDAAQLGLPVAFEDANSPDSPETSRDLDGEELRNDAGEPGEPGAPGEEPRYEHVMGPNGELISKPIVQRRKRVYTFRVKNLSEGENECKVQVSAEDGTAKEYKLTIVRKPWSLDGWKPGNMRAKYRWYLQGAEDGNAEAQYRLAMMYDGKDGHVMVPPDHTVELFSTAPETCKPEELVQISPDVAMIRHYKWLVFAAENGHVVAQKALATLYAQNKVPSHAEESLENERQRMLEAAEEAGTELRAFAESGPSDEPNGALTDRSSSSLDLLRDHSMARSRNNKAVAFLWWKQAARQGDRAAAEHVAKCYLEGYGVEHQFKPAVLWLHKAGMGREASVRNVFERLQTAADDGDGPSARQAAQMIMEGLTEHSKDYEEARHYLHLSDPQAPTKDLDMEMAEFFKSAAEQGDKQAAYQMARLHMDGILKKDYKMALHYLHMSGMEKNKAYDLVLKTFTQAAEEGNQESAAVVAELYLDGIGVHMDYTEALAWLERAGWLSDEAERHVAKHLLAAAERGNTRSCYQCGLLHIHGVGVEQSYTLAADYLARAGEHVTVAQQQAAAFFEQASNDGDARAAYQRALMHCDGAGVPLSYKDALEWLTVRAGQSEEFAQRLVHDRLLAAAERRHVASCAELAAMYMNFPVSLKWLVADGYDENWFHAQAATWLQCAGEEGDTASALALGRAYVQGQGVPIDFTKATFWFEQAGKDKRYAKKQIEKKLLSIKPHYKRLFNAYAKRSGGQIDLNQFAGFYRDCLMAKGMSKEKAISETKSVYQGKMKYEILFRAYDKNRDHSIDFDEVWSHTHTHTTLFPKTGRHVMAAIRYFANWRPLAHQDSLASLGVGKSPRSRISPRGRLRKSRSKSRNGSRRRLKKEATIPE